MIRRLSVLAMLFGAPRDALACEGRASCDKEHAAAPDARRASKDARHIGQHCSYSTAAMIGRVLDRGDAWTYEGPLEPVDAAGTDAHAVPYLTLGGDRVLANEVLDQIVSAEPPTLVNLVGRVLVQGGARYVVVTGATSGR